MATLTGNSVASTYKQLLKITSEGLGADASAKYVEDGEGTDSALSLSTTRVGIGTTSPGAKLEVDSGDLILTGTATNHLVLPLNDDASTPTLAFGDGDTGFYESSANYMRVAIGGAARFEFGAGDLKSLASAGRFIVGTNFSSTTPSVTKNGDFDTGIGWAAADQLSLIAGGVEGHRITESAGAITHNLTGNVGIGATSFGTSAEKVIAIANGTAPSSSPADMVQLYAEDVSTSELKVRDEAGNVTTLSPHNFSMVNRSDPMAWSYYSKNEFLGKELNVDMMKVIRTLETLTGESFIEMRDLGEKLDWDVEEQKKYDARQLEIESYNKQKEGFDSIYQDWLEYPTKSNTKAEITAWLNDNDIDYEDGIKAELLELVNRPDEPTFTQTQPDEYVKNPKPDWLN